MISVMSPECGRSVGDFMALAR